MSQPRKSRPPVILIGMHRSGTSVLTRALETLGLFVGWRLDANHEPRFFRRLNDWALCQANASWDHPESIRHLDAFHRRHVQRVFTRHLHGVRRLEFLGPWKFATNRDIRSLDIAWGWKDPRNTFTIEFWDQIFPDAKVVHLYRMPLDVAASLRRREQSRRAAFRVTLEHRFDEMTLPRRPIFGGSPRVENVREGIQLWQEYSEQIDRLSDRLGRRLLQVRYETLVDAPVETLGRVLEFLEMDAPEVKVDRVATQVDSSKKFEFKGSEELVQIYSEMRHLDIMKRLGYERLL